jgi:hypothetical protein
MLDRVLVLTSSLAVLHTEHAMVSNTDASESPPRIRCDAASGVSVSCDNGMRMSPRTVRAA